MAQLVSLIVLYSRYINNQNLKKITLSINLFNQLNVHLKKIRKILNRLKKFELKCLIFIFSDCPIFGKKTPDIMQKFSVSQCRGAKFKSTFIFEAKLDDKQINSVYFR